MDMQQSKTKLKIGELQTYLAEPSLPAYPWQA